MSNSIAGNTTIAGATVNYTGAASGSTTSDGSGNYTIAGLSAGTYVISVSKSHDSFAPLTRSVTISGSNVTGVNFAGAANASAPDCRVPPNGPNDAVIVQSTLQNTKQTSANSAVPGTDSRAAGAPADSRTAANIPLNSRAS